MPIGIVIFFSLLLFLFLVYLFLISTKRCKALRPFLNVKYAHRGLHNSERAENSMSAFRAAVEAGFGIELDVRLSLDGKLVVFHDDTLERVVGREGRVDAFTYEELQKMSLCDTADGIPLFTDVLAMVSGRVPLLVEIKEDAGVHAVSDECARILSGYDGAYIVESFNPLSLKNFGKKLGGVPLGILSQKYTKEKKYRKPLFYILQLMLINRIAGVSFIAFNHEHHRSLSLFFARLFFGAKSFAWTVRSEEEERLAKKHGFTSVIFENYLPEK